MSRVIWISTFSIFMSGFVFIAGVAFGNGPEKTFIGGLSLAYAGLCFFAVKETAEKGQP